MEFAKEFFRFVMQRKKYVLIPILITSVLLGALIYVAQGSTVAPFVYTLF